MKLRKGAPKRGEREDRLTLALAEKDDEPLSFR